MSFEVVSTLLGRATATATQGQLQVSSTWPDHSQVRLTLSSQAPIIVDGDDLIEAVRNAMHAGRG